MIIWIQAMWWPGPLYHRFVSYDVVLRLCRVGRSEFEATRGNLSLIAGSISEVAV